MSTSSNFQRFAESPIIAMIPMELRDLSPGLKQELIEAFRYTSFDCPECGGDTIPFSLKQGVCFQCKHVADLDECNYDSTAQDSDDADAREKLQSAARYLKQEHGRTDSQLARRILTTAGRFVGTDQEIDLSNRYLRNS